MNDLSNFMLMIVWAGLIGLFIMCFQMMSESMEKVFGNKIRNLASTHIVGKNGREGIGRDVFYGLSLSAIVQSSSATLGAVLGFASAGAISIHRALGMIVGANLGALITIQMLSFNLLPLAPLGIGIGLLSKQYAEKENTKNIGQLIVSISSTLLVLGLIKMFSVQLGLNAVGDRFIGLYDGHPLDVLFGVFIGFVVSAVIRSGTMTIAILMAVAVGGFIHVYLLLPITIGANLGSCVTALIGALNETRQVKRIAVLHFIFNGLGALLLGIFLLGPIMKMFPLLGSNVTRQIANLHTLFNLLTAVIVILIQKPLIIGIEKLMPIAPSEEIMDKKLENHLNKQLLNMPSLALLHVTREVELMGEGVSKMLHTSMRAFAESDYTKVQKVFAQEAGINQMEHDIMEFMVELSNAPSISSHDRIWIDQLFSTVNDIERIGDHSENLAELAAERIEKEMYFSTQALSELKEMHGLVARAYQTAMESLSTQDVNKARDVIKLEQEIDDREKSLRKTHIKRLNEGACNPSPGVIFLDIISNLERVGDHALNIAMTVLENEMNGVYIGRRIE